MNASDRDSLPAGTQRARPGMRYVLAVLLACAGAASAAHAGIKHGYLMRGQILESEGGNLVVCVGESDGAKVGQVLSVVRHVRVATAPKQAGPRYRRQAVGSVKITALFDGHYADATVVSGSPRVHDTVELVSR